MLDGSIDMQDRDNRLPHSSRRSDVARFEYGQRGLSRSRARRIRSARYASLSVYTLSSATASLPVSLSIRHVAVRTCERSSTHARSISPRAFPRLPFRPPRPRSRPISKIAFSSSPLREFIITSHSISTMRQRMSGIRWVFIHPAAAFHTNSPRKKLHHVVDYNVSLIPRFRFFLRKMMHDDDASSRVFSQQLSFRDPVVTAGRVLGSLLSSSLSRSVHLRSLAAL